jgi:taurine dioxygenase
MSKASGFTFEPITPTVGAVVGGADLRRSLSAGETAELRAALLQHGALFFRGQDLSQDEMAVFMESFGPLCPDPFSYAALQPPPGRDTIVTIPTRPSSKATQIWHLDSTLAATPASIISLRAVELPPVGGDTCWGSMYAAYEALSAPLREMLDGLTAEHSAFKVMPLMEGSWPGILQEDMRNIHPVVRVHPETGRKALFVNELWTEKIVELSTFESERLLAMLYEHARSMEFTMRWRWRVNDIVVWDNRAFQHYAVRDYTAARALQKTLIAGDRPYGPRRGAGEIRQSAFA